MIIITITGFKGGVGKSVTAMHLAAYFSDRGKTLLVDSDPNHTLKSWADRGIRKGNPLPFGVITTHQVARETRGCEYVIFDTPASPTSEDLVDIVSASDLIILPSIPDVNSILPMADTLAAINGANCRVVLTIVPAGKDGANAYEDLVAGGYPVCQTMIRRTVAYGRASVLGMTVRDLPYRELSAFWEDYAALGRELEEALKSVEVRK